MPKFIPLIFKNDEQLLEHELFAHGGELRPFGLTEQDYVDLLAEIYKRILKIGLSETPHIATYSNQLELRFDIQLVSDGRRVHFQQGGSLASLANHVKRVSSVNALIVPSW